MGWWPFSSSSTPAAGEASGSVSQSSDLLPPTTTTTKARAAPPKQLSREQQADAELEAFLASLEASETPKPTPSATQTSHREPPSQQAPSLWDRLRQKAPFYPPEPSTDPTSPSVPGHPTSAPSPDHLNISPAALRPRTMSCRAAFDAAFYCASLGGKFNDIYRFGSLQPCSEHWEAFWFCMRQRSIGGGDEEKGERIAEYYASREKRELARRAGGRSSEDVWEMRTEPVEKAFWKVP